MVELARRGHNITVVSPFPKSKQIDNFQDIDVDQCNNMSMDIYVLDEAYKSHDPFYQISVLFSLKDLEEPFLLCPPVQQLLASNYTYDLIVTEIFCSNLMFAFAEKFHAPHVSFCPSILFPWAADHSGTPDNPSYITYPHSYVIVEGAVSTFYQRLYNTALYLYGKTMFYLTNQKSELQKQKYFKFIEPTLQQIAKNTSLILTFSHFSINNPRPLPPNVIEVGGLQISNANTLPKDIEEFINESEHGVIYFCLGSLLKTETMSEEKKNAFLYAFSRIAQKVLWKWGDDVLPGKTDKIFISKWMPQRDILAHPKVKLFITHGGALGLNEAVYEGIPVLGIPMFAEQTVNIKALKTRGAAEILEYTDINNNTVLSKLQLMLNNDKYSKNMREVSKIFRDRPTKPLDTAVYWTEYIIRYKGAPHLRSAAVDMPLYQYLLLDIIAFLLLVFFITIMLIYYGTKALYNTLCGSKSKKKLKTNQNESRKTK